MTSTGLRRYGPFARWYDALSGERLVYRAGRVAGIDALRLRAGDRILDAGCGTGLDFALLEAGVGPTGSIVGVDAAEAMLVRARARTSRHGWGNITLVRGDAADVDALLQPGAVVDAALFTYALSVIGDWERAWSAVLARVRPGGRVAVVDLGLPTGSAWTLRPLAGLACRVGGADPHRVPWRLVVEQTDDVVQRELRAGHVHVAAGTVRRTAVIL